MRAPDFWRREPRSLEASLLSPLAAVWGAIAARRMRRPRPPAPAPVLCVGNFVAGGAGKTPVTALACEILESLGFGPAVLSRGYGGSLSGKRPVRVDPERHGAHQVGDEPLLLARKALVVIGTDRQASCAMACALGARSIVMDDGFQSASLAPTVSLIVADAQIGVGNGLVLPAGPLRAPLSSQWTLASALVLIGEGEPGDHLAREAGRRGLPVFHAVLKPDPARSRELAGRPVLAFAGIGRPEKFYATLSETGAQIVGRRSYADHHRYTRADMALLVEAAKAAGAEQLVTTEKDLVRIVGRGGPGATDIPIGALPVSVQIAEEASFSIWLSLTLRAADPLSAPPRASP